MTTELPDCRIVSRGPVVAPGWNKRKNVLPPAMVRRTRFVMSVLGTSIQVGDERLVAICNWYPAAGQEIATVFPADAIVKSGPPPDADVTVTLTGLDVFVPPRSSVARAV